MKILFVCLGNICRSPAAHGVMEHILMQRKLTEKVMVDSCGTAGYHIGELPDSRMRKAAELRGIKLTHHARQLCKRDLEDYDMIVAMDDSNYSNIVALNRDKKDKVKKMIMFVKEKKGYDEIPDPYYGDEEGFNLVLDLVNDGCEGILESLKL